MCVKTVRVFKLSRKCVSGMSRDGQKIGVRKAERQQKDMRYYENRLQLKIHLEQTMTKMICARADQPTNDIRVSTFAFVATICNVGGTFFRRAARLPSSEEASGGDSCPVVAVVHLHTLLSRQVKEERKHNVVA